MVCLFFFPLALFAVMFCSFNKFVNKRDKERGEEERVCVIEKRKREKE